MICVVTRCICLHTPGTGVEMRGMRPGNTLLKPLGMDNWFLSHLWISFTMDKCSTKTIPSPILSKTLTKNAQLIQQTGKLKLTNYLKHNSLTAIISIRKVLCIAGTLGKMFYLQTKKLANNSSEMEFRLSYNTKISLWFDYRK